MSNFDTVLLDHDRAVFLNENGVITYQRTDNCDDAPMLGGEGSQYWMADDAILFAETILAHRVELLTQQKEIEAILYPLADYLFEYVGQDKVFKLRYSWGFLRNELRNALTILYNAKHPLAHALWNRIHQKGSYSHRSIISDQLESLLDHVLYKKLREQHPITVYIDQDEIDAAEEEDAERIIKESEPQVHATCHSDDFAIEVNDFEATLWFTQASDEELLALRAISYGGDYAADVVAEYIAQYNTEIEAMFHHNDALGKNVEARGFECYVNEEEAEAWIAAHRPHLQEEEN